MSRIVNKAIDELNRNAFEQSFIYNLDRIDYVHLKHDPSIGNIYDVHIIFIYKEVGKTEIEIKKEIFATELLTETYVKVKKFNIH